MTLTVTVTSAPAPAPATATALAEDIVVSATSPLTESEIVEQLMARDKALTRESATKHVEGLKAASSIACIALPGSDAMLFWPLATSTNSAKKGLAQQAAVTAKATPIGSHADTKGTPTKKTGTPSKYMTPTRRPRLRKPFSTPRQSHAATPSRILSSTERGVFSRQALQQPIDKLEADVDCLKKDISALQEKYCADELDSLIHKLHVYNDLKDVAQAVLGIIAREKGMTTKEVYEQYDLAMED